MQSEAEFVRRHKCTKYEMRQRIDAILGIILDGAQFHDIVRYAREHNWCVTSRHLRTYMRRANDIIVKRLETNQQRRIGVHIAMRQTLFARCIDAADYSNARGILSDLAKLEGLYPAGKVQVEMKQPISVAELSDEELAKIASEAVNDDSTTSREGTDSAAAVPLELDGLHPLYEAGLRDELASQVNRGEARPVGEGGDSAVDVVHATATRQERASESATSGDDIRPTSVVACD